MRVRSPRRQGNRERGSRISVLAPARARAVPWAVRSHTPDGDKPPMADDRHPNSQPHVPDPSKPTARTTADDAGAAFPGHGAAGRPAPGGGKTFFGHPRCLSTLFFTEMWERFSYYGLRPLLVLFMAAALIDGGFGFDRDQASAIVGIYGFSVYLASLPGGWVADRLLGLQRAIFVGACLITSGHLSIGLSGLAGPDTGKIFFFMGLVLIVMGTGLLKPNISAMVGDMYPEGGSRQGAGLS